MNEFSDPVNSISRCTVKDRIDALLVEVSSRWPWIVLVGNLKYSKISEDDQGNRKVMFLVSQCTYLDRSSTFMSPMQCFPKC